MKFFQKLFIVSLFLLPAVSQSQITGSDSFIHLPYDYHFCSGNQEICIAIPANWGFQVPYLKGHDASLNISSGIVNYTADFSKVKQSSFMFAMPNSKTPCLELRISSYEEFDESNSTIKSDYGNFQLVENDEKKVEAYQYIYSSNMLTFRILTNDDKEKQVCRDIIASAKEYYTVESEYGNGSYLEGHSINYYTNDSTIYPSLGLVFITPFDVSGYIRAKKIEINEATTLLTATVTLDQLVDYEDNAAEFDGNNFTMKYRFYKNESKDDMHEIVTGSYNESCIRSNSFPVSTINSTIYSLGSSYMPTIKVVIPTKEYFAVFEFEDVDKQKLENIYSFISKIYIADSLHTDKNADLIPSSTFENFVEVVNINTSSDVKDNLPDIYIMEQKIDKNIKVVQCKVPELKAEIFIPVFEDGVILNKGEMKSGSYKDLVGKKNVVILHNGAEPQEGCYAAILSYSSATSTQCILWIPENAEGLSAAEYLYKQYAPNECTYGSEVKRVGKCNIKGKEWYVFTDNDLATYVTEHGGSLIEIKVSVPSSYSYYEEGEEPKIDYSVIMDSLLYKAVFK